MFDYFILRIDRTNLRFLYSQGGFSPDMLEAVIRVGTKSSDTRVDWKQTTGAAQTMSSDRTFLVSTDDQKSLGILSSSPRSQHGNVRGSLPLAVHRWNGVEIEMIDRDRKKELFLKAYGDYEYDSDFHDVLVVDLNPKEEVFWQLCDAKSVPGEALVVDRSAQGELLFFGYKAGSDEVGSRLGYVRTGMGLIHYHRTAERGIEVRWEVKEGFFVLCAREKLFEADP